jgi:diaminopimelate epimerase
MILPFTKCHANGNDFIFILSDDFPKESRTKHIIRRLCCRHTGIGADGLFVISPSEKLDFLLDYYNSDGSWETLCANGSRCAVQFMHQCGHIENKADFLAGDGPHSAKILEGDVVSMQMNIPKYRSGILSPAGYDGYFIDSGARHFVSESENISDDFVRKNGRDIRNSHLFDPRGINVNFYKLVNKHTVDIKTYEKGVEQVMLSCASGSTAVIFHLSKNKRVESPVLVRSTGGNLTFYFDEPWGDVWVTGPAEILFTGSFNMNIITK